jgi:NADPH-dependent 2,4-dienoyl-CoA reductase/sulfur reductase-like enzyme
MSEPQQAEVSRVVIVGASLAGASAAAALREQGFAGTIEMIGVEAHPPYERSELSKSILLGEAGEPSWVRPPGWYAEHGISLVSPTLVTEVRPAEHVAVTGNSQHAYDKLLLATGSAPRTLKVPGNELRQILTLRTWDDALMIANSLQHTEHVVVIGADWIGCEVAAAARRHGADVTLVEAALQPLAGVVGERLGQLFADLHREQGVDVRVGVTVEAFEHAADSQLDGVRLSDGSLVPAELVILSLGAEPRVGLADAAGLELAEGGVAVDATLRTSDPDIYAVGDVAAHEHPRLAGRVRVSDWVTATSQGTHVAQNLLGAEAPYEGLPCYSSRQYGMTVELRGLPDPENDQLVLLGDLTRGCTALWLRDGTVSGALDVRDPASVDHPVTTAQLQHLLDGRTEVSEDDLLAGRF